MGIPPVITTTTPVVTVTPFLSTGTNATISAPVVSYNQILQSLGTYVYGGEFIYIYSTNIQQIQQPFGFNHFDANGNKIQTYLPFAVDPFQKQGAKYFETNPDEVVLDGFSALAFVLNAGNTLYFKIFTLVEANTLYLNQINPDEFQQMAESMGSDFFNDFCNYLIDQEDAPQT